MSGAIAKNYRYRVELHGDLDGDSWYTVRDRSTGALVCVDGEPLEFENHDDAHRWCETNEGPEVRRS